MNKSLMLIVVVALLVNVVGALSFITSVTWATAEEATIRVNSQTSLLRFGEGGGIALGITPTPTDTPAPPTDTPTATATDTPAPPTDTPMPPTDTPASPTKTPKPPPPPSPTPTPIPLLPEAGSSVGSEWVSWAAPAFVAVFFLMLSTVMRKARD